MKTVKFIGIITLVVLLTSTNLNVSFASDDFFSLDDALTNTVIVDGTTVKTYNIDALPKHYPTRI